MPVLIATPGPPAAADGSCPWSFAAVPRPLGGLAARASGAGVTVRAVRVTFWDASRFKFRMAFLSPHTVPL
jgi:hypothetical protein